MKKIYSLMLALFATLCVGTAYAVDPVKFTINVDDPNAIKLTMTEGYGEKTLTLVAGDNEISVPYSEDYQEYELLTVNVNSGYLLDSLTLSPKDAPAWEDYSSYGGPCRLSVVADCEGAVYSFHTTNLNTLRQDSVVVIIDNPSKVKVMYYGSGQINITNDTTVVYYCSDPEVTSLQDLPLTVRANNPYSGDLIYKVFLNSDEVKKVVEYGEEYYPFNTLAEGDTIRVLTEAPADLTAPAILKLDEIAKEALDSVLVNGVKVELKDTILVPWGKKIELAFNIEDYKVTANNTTLGNYSNPYSAVVTDTTIIEVTAVKYDKYDVTLILHDYTCFEQLYVDNYIYPEEDTTILSMNSKSPRITLYAADDCLIDSIKWNNELKTGTTIECSAEGVLEVWAHKIVRNEKFMLYVERDSMSSMSMMSKTYHYFAGYYAPLSADYTECAFSVADDNPISASFNNKSYNRAICYLNDEILTYSYDGYEIADGDVFKVFADTADVYTVGIYVAGDAVVENATKDRIVAITDLKKNFDVLQGTEVSFKTEATVFVNGVVAEGVDGVYTLVINENTTIVVGELTTCAEANVAAANTVLAMDEFVVAYVNGSYTYIQDATGSALIYKSNYGLNAGDTVTGLVGKISVFKNLVEIVPSMTVDKLNVKAGVAPEPALQEEVITLADVNKYIRIEGVTVNKADTFTTAGNETINAVWNDTTLVMFNKFKVAQIFSADSIYDIVCAVSVFNEQLQVYLISATAAAQPEPEIAQYQLHGSWIENWGGPKLEIAEDEATATATMDLKEGNYNFGIKQIDAADKQLAWMWTANVEGDTFTREANAFTFIKQETIDEKDNGKNPTLAADVDGVYTFVWTYADNKLTITFPAKPEGIFNATVEGQAEKFVRDGQLIIRMNGVEYNVLGAKLQ